MYGSKLTYTHTVYLVYNSISYKSKDIFTLYAFNAMT